MDQQITNWSDFNVCHPRCVCNYIRGSTVNNKTCLEKMLYSKNETTCFSLYWPASGFYNIKTV